MEPAMNFSVYQRCVRRRDRVKHWLRRAAGNLKRTMICSAMSLLLAIQI
jgi:hypothetical protein